MHADLEQQIFVALLAVEPSIASRISSAARRPYSGVGNVAITASPMVLTMAPTSRAPRRASTLEVRLHELVRDEIADALVELGRALEVGEEHGEAGELEPLIDAQRVGAIEIAERLVGEETFGGEEGLLGFEEVMKRVVGDEQARHDAARGLVLERETKWSGPKRGLGALTPLEL